MSSHSLKWRKKWQLTSVFLPGKFHELRSWMGYSPWGSQKSQTQLSIRIHTALKLPWPFQENNFLISSQLERKPFFNPCADASLSGCWARCFLSFLSIHKQMSRFLYKLPSLLVIYCHSSLPPFIIPSHSQKIQLSGSTLVLLPLWLSCFCYGLLRVQNPFLCTVTDCKYSKAGDLERWEEPHSGSEPEKGSRCYQMLHLKWQTNNTTQTGLGAVCIHQTGGDGLLTWQRTCK